MYSKSVLIFSLIFWVISLAAYSQDSAAGDANENGKPAIRKPMKDYGLKEYVYLSKDLPHVEEKSWRLVCQMPYNCHFQPWIRLRSAEGKRVDLNSSNALVLYLTKTETYQTSVGEQAYEARNCVSG